jgi:hypothetical protein
MNSILRISLASVALAFGLALAAAACSTDSDTSGQGNCTDGAKDGAETDIDCGGPNCNKCFEDQACSVASDCQTASCEAGKCEIPATPTCSDMIKNGTETDVDCSGGCALCGVGKVCDGGGDCASGVCTAGKCIASSTPSCTDGIKNGDETDVDCGGGTCPACGYMKGCAAPSDCLDAVCTNMQCASPSCYDGKLNSDETDVDCGGSLCPPCATGKMCEDGTDCVSKVCTSMDICM